MAAHAAWRISLAALYRVQSAYTRINSIAGGSGMAASNGVGGNRGVSAGKAAPSSRHGAGADVATGEGKSRRLSAKPGGATIKRKRNNSEHGISRSGAGDSEAASVTLCM